mgnify:CR=1 FL=1|tara:strand:+ start:1268 stop:1468 length:201 start_codon:yes stop_codon:yes gene_type:complete
MKESKGVKKQGQDLFDQWNAACKINEGDSFTEKLKKVMYRLGGILLMILFSPILLIIFIFVVAVSL